MVLRGLLQKMGFPLEAVDAEEILESLTDHCRTLDALPHELPKEAFCRALPELDHRLAGKLVLLAAKFLTLDLADLALTLLECGAPATLTTADGWTALMVLAANYDRRPAHRALALALVQRGCPVDAVSPQGRFALEIAHSERNLELLVTLLENGASLQPLGGRAVLSWLNHLPRHVNWRPPTASSNAGALVARATRLLVAAGADPDALFEGFAPLHDLAFTMAAYGFSVEAHLALLEELLALGADPNATDIHGHAVVHCLLGMNLREAEDMDATGLQHCRKALVALVRAGCDINVRTLFGIRTWPLHQAVELAAGVSLEAAPDWVAFVGFLLELGADPTVAMSEFGWDNSALSTLVEAQYEGLPEDVPGGDAPVAMVDLARMLAVAECQRSGSAYVQMGLQILHQWLGSLMQCVFEPSGQRSLQLRPGQLQFTEVLLRYCCPPSPWPAEFVTPQGEPLEEATARPSSSLITAALHMGNMQLLEMVLLAIPPSERYFLESGGLQLSLHLCCCSMLANRLKEEQPPPPQGQLEERHAFHLLQFCRQAEVLARAGVVAEPLIPAVALKLSSMGPAWGRELMKLAASIAAGVWHAAYHWLYPPAFKAAARTLLLINSCRGFAARRLGSRGQEWQLTSSSSSSSSSSRQQRGVQLPGEVLEQILYHAASPPMRWMPELFPFMTAEERQRWGSSSTGTATSSGAVAAAE